MFNDFINFVKEIYGYKKLIQLHEPQLIGNEKKYLSECVESTFVSSVGKFVNEFEKKIAKYVGSKYAIATCNGTSAIHTSLILAGVGINDEVITQPLNFIASSNAVKYCNANLIFIDVDLDTMGLSPSALKIFLKKNTIVKNKRCINKKTNRIIKACVPMHSYGNPCKIDKIREICNEFCIFLIEDAAESLGSFYKKKHTGTFGKLGVISFNGNKIITAGGGGCIVTNDLALAKKAKHLTTTAKVPHKWFFNHDMIGYNYRMPNINAALLVAQLEKLNDILNNKRMLANKYKNFFKNKNIIFFKEPKNSKSNYWLNCIILKDRIQRNKFLKFTNSNNITTRPIWKLMHKLKIFQDAQYENLKNSEWLYERVVNIPSSPTL